MTPDRAQACTKVLVKSAWRAYIGPLPGRLLETSRGTSSLHRGALAQVEAIAFSPSSIDFWQLRVRRYDV